MNSLFKRIVCILLCLCMTAGTFLLLTSCGKGGEDSPEGDQTDNGKITVLRALTLLEKGKRLSSSDFEEVVVDAASVPEGALTSADQVTSKYLNTILFPGDYVFADKVSDTKDGDMSADSGQYIVVTDYITSNKERLDSYEIIQKIIDDNPNKTIYFPDGEYMISKPIVVPTSPEKAVSLRLSYRAVIKPSSIWSGKSGEGILILGMDGEKAASKGAEATCTISGGVIETGNKATGIIARGAGNILISNLAVKGSDIGIHIKTSRVDVDNVVITGSNTPKCIGVLVDGSYNTLSNMRIYRINTGIKLTKGNNVLRNLHPLYSPDKSSETSYGFHDTSEGNYYDYCYSDQLAIGFYLGDGNASVLNGCFAYWYSNDVLRHWGAYAEGRFNAIIRNCRFDNDDYSPGDPAKPTPPADNAYIVVENDALDHKGKIIDPVNKDNDPYGDANAFNNMFDENCDLARFRVK